MEHRVRYTLLGLFVFGLFFAGAWLMLWQSKYSHNESFCFYQVQTGESVSGLNEKAPVKLRGVNVGEVTNLYINPEDSETVNIIIKIKSGTPIKTDTYALIEPQGITGLSYLQLEGGSKEAPFLKAAADKMDEMSIILTKPSLFSRVDQSFESVAKKIEALLESAIRILESTHSLVGQANIDYINEILKNSATTSKALAESAQSLASKKDEIYTLVEQAIVLEKKVIEAAKAVKIMSETGTLSMHKVGSSANSVQELMEKLKEKSDSGMFDVAGAARDVTIPLKKSLQEMEILMRELRDLTKSIEESPSDLLYRSVSQNPAPGE
ncbi:MAG: MCE family protein [Campylobacteraceae bacterium]|nr:MCE family protein [Campylobacteraceae bacterium]